MSYLADLSMRLAGGATAFPDEFRQRHAAYLAQTINPDGGYSGRQGGSDAYYTSFALRGLAMLGDLDPGIAASVASFLQSRDMQEMSSIDFFSWLFSAELLRLVAGLDVLDGNDLLSSDQDRAQAIAASVDRYRRPDGGYAKSPSSPGSSIYHTFLALACKQLFKSPADSQPQPDFSADAGRLVHSHRRDDGGYVEIKQMRQSGTNPTAAAVAILRITGQLDDPTHKDTRESAIDSLSAMQTPDGGFRANTRIPVADLLSTFTALAALHGLTDNHTKKLPDVVDLAAARRYAENLKVPSGGFRAGVWDDSPDVEYTFYGLGTLALLNAEGFSDNG
ncbi:MAG: prenyltransferase/squalene oxidase repeat-containing protein [Planctomycetota bacterium]|nr:prenyltransferase/squalene oxidase repeat-containing protein [Planctomycetota bacterium]